MIKRAQYSYNVKYFNLNSHNKARVPREEPHLTIFSNFKDSSSTDI